MNLRQSSGRRRASSVVELMVALGILTFGVAAVYEHYIGLTRMGTDQVERAQARLLAHQELETLRACRYDQLVEWMAPLGTMPIKDDMAFYSATSIDKRPDGALALTVKVWRAQQNNNTPPAESATAHGVVLP